MFQTNNPHPAIHANNINKSMLAAAISLGMGTFSFTGVTNAALPSGALLSFDPGIIDCPYGVKTDGSCKYGVSNVSTSYFLMDNNGDGSHDLSSEGVLISPGPDFGIEIGAIQPATGSHGGEPGTGTVVENPHIDAPWNFFGNTGMHYTNVAPVVASDGGNTQTLNFSGWRVTWNGIPEIDMGGGLQDCGTTTDGICVDANLGDISGTFDNGTSLATVTCTAGCVDGDSFILDYESTVPQADPSGFGGVFYGFHIEGTISLPGSPPNTQPDNTATIAGNPVVINVLDNDSSADGLDPASVTVVTPASDGSTDDTSPDGSITYSPDTGPNFVGTDNFEYTVDSLLGTTSAATMVDVDVQNNVAPIAIDDPASTNTVAFDNAGGNLEINALKNDTDANNDPGLPGGIDVTTVNVLTQPSIGSCAADPVTGKVNYSQALPSVPVSTSCTYEVKDIDSFGAPLTSNVATVDIDVTSLNSDWPPSLDPDIIPFLIFDDGVPNNSGNTADVPESGTYFSMDVSANTTIYTTLTKGPDGGFIIGYDQLATGSHTGLPTGNETSSVDLGWNFFGNTGLTFTTNGGITGNTDGTLKFSGENGGQGKYQITWNGIPEIDLGGSDQFPEDLGFALIECDPAPCADGSTYDMTYEAHVPPGDPSGFGGVQYRLVMNGTVAFLDGSFQTSSGTFSVEERSQAGDSNIEPDPDSEIQCAGGCFDYTITGVNGPSVSVVLPLNSGVPASTLGQVQLRVFREGAWGNFDTSGNNSVMSAAFTSGGPFGTTCPPPGDAAYGTLTEGHQCLQVTIEDNGPNDKSSAVGTISDPSGLGIPTIVQGPDTRTSGTSGCTVASTSVSPLSGGAWWMLAGLASWVGWKRRQSKLH